MDEEIQKNTISSGGFQMLTMWEEEFLFLSDKKYLMNRIVLHARRCVDIGGKVEKKADTSPASPAHDVRGRGT